MDSRFHFLALLIIIVLSGCEIKSLPSTVIIEGYLMTPEGKFEFKNTGYLNAEEMELPYPKRLRYSYVVAEAKNIKVIYSPLDSIQNLWIAFSRDESSDRRTILLGINNEETVFEDGGEMQTMFRTNISEGRAFLRSGFQSEGTSFGYVKLTGEIPSEASSNKTYSFQVPFTIDGEKYLAYLKFKKSSKKRLVEISGVPGMP